MKVKDQKVRIRKIEVSGVEHTEAEGYMARVRAQLEVPLDDQKQVLDTKLKNAIHQVLTVSRAKTTEKQKNSFVLTAKEDFGLIEHSFVAPDQKTTVCTIGSVKHVSFRVVEGELSMRYNFDAPVSLANLATLVSYMDAESMLTTTTVQGNILDFIEENVAA